MQNEIKPLVAIVGRPNVGKSTLFNRLAGERSAIVSETPGTTRDRVTTQASWGDRPFILVDTGGLAPAEPDDLWTHIEAQVHTAIVEADAIIFVVDAETGLVEADKDIAGMLRQTLKPLMLAANKADNESRESQALEFFELGLGEPQPISAYHNRGIDDLMAGVLEALPETPPSPEPEADLRLAIVGRTNVGKSTLVNLLAGSERAIVSETPGTTRDALDTLIDYGGQPILLIDTAGMRRRGRVAPGLERYSVIRAIRAVERAQVAILLIDATELATSQDAHIAGYILDAYKGIVLVVNKWDEAPTLELGKSQALDLVRRRFKFAPHVPVCFISALRDTGVKEMIETAQAVHREWGKGVPRYGLRRVVMEAIAKHPPSMTGKRSLKIFSVTQDQAGPPGFTFYVNRPDMVHFSYQRYLENTIRDAYGFQGSRLRLQFKGKGTP